ncbi:MAG: hypothetical protein EBR17_07210 [Betaproteobacteria bacterium]|jgi:Tfp pilus assembly protein PilO|nr:hypothetical protein [Betaproteobacteria bacterium]NBX90922.1 hypothetical protein [Betaproteobacteria bacterium]
MSLHMKIISALFLQHAPRYALMWRNARWEQFVWLRRAGFLLATMAAALCSYALSMAALGLDQDRHGHAKAEQEALAAQLLQQRIWLKQKNQQAQAHEQLEALVLAQEAQWPSPAQSNALLTRLQGLAETLGLFVEVFQVQEPIKVGGYPALPLQLRLRGPAAAVFEFWSGINQGNFGWLTEQVSWSASAQGVVVFQAHAQLLLAGHALHQEFIQARPARSHEDMFDSKRLVAAPKLQGPAAAKRSAPSQLPHVLPEWPLAKMRLVGLIESPHLGDSAPSLALISAGKDIHRVQWGQQLGLEGAHISRIDSAGLSLNYPGSNAQASTEPRIQRLNWEVLAP